MVYVAFNLSCFLIVGNKHGCLGRYFSHLSKYINRINYSGSPLSLQKLFETAPNIKDGGIIPKVNRQVGVFYAFIRPFTNKSIHNYQIPHIFCFIKVFGRWYMQYQIYSGFKHWLSRKPANIISRELMYEAPIVVKIHQH